MAAERALTAERAVAAERAVVVDAVLLLESAATRGVVVDVKLLMYRVIFCTRPIKSLGSRAFNKRKSEYKQCTEISGGINRPLLRED
jgi:hypothetical protein